jgi:integrase
MGVIVRERKDKPGWWVFAHHRGQRTKKCFGADKRAAKAFAAQLEARITLAKVRGEPLVLSQPDQAMPTVRAYLTDWLTTYADAHCKASTASDYRKVINRHILPALGDRRLHEVTRADIKRLIASLIAQGRKKQTIHNILTPLKEAYHHAIDDGIVTMNPATSMGRLVTTRESAGSHIDPLTAEEVRTLLQTAQEKRTSLYSLLLCAVRTGMRQGELIGLQWGDVDFRGMFIEVRRAVVRRSVTTTKTHKIRRVDMSPQLASVLQALKETRSLECAMKGKPMPEWVFLGAAGDRVNDDILRKAFYDCLDKAELRRVRFHDLRHTFASLLIQQGANPKYVQETLGHGSIAVTLDIYSHLFKGDHRHHVSRLDDPQNTTGDGEGKDRDYAPQAHPVVSASGSGAVEVAGIT